MEFNCHLALSLEAEHFLVGHSEDHPTADLFEQLIKRNVLEYFNDDMEDVIWTDE